jgi:hypothetical protein
VKTTLKIIAFYTLALILGGCMVLSLHPLFTENELIFDANLIGTWAPVDSNETCQFKPTSGKNYECTYIDNNGESSKFIAGLGKLGNSAYLDIYPNEPNMAGNYFYLPAHSFMKIELSKDALKLCAMSSDSIDSLLKSKPNAVKHEKLEDGDNGRLVLTASTKELQKFILKYDHDEKLELFGKIKDSKPMHRVNPQ